MASTLSHELKQPLATIAFAAENGRLRLVGQHDTNSQKALEKFDKILEQVERARAISGKMLAHAKAEADAQAEFDLESAIRAAQSQTANLMQEAGVQFGEISIPEPASILGFSRLSFELILLNGFFAMSELAVISSRRARLQALAEAGSKTARAALKLAEAPGPFLSTVQIGITMIGIFAGAYGEKTLTASLSAWLAGFPPLAAVSDGLALAVVVAGITYFSLILGELVPKRLALANAERIASVVAGSPAYIVTVDGARYFEGALLPSGHRIMQIAAQRVTVERDGQPITLNF